MSGTRNNNNLAQIDFQKVDVAVRCIPNAIHDCLQALVSALEREIARILGDARDREVQFQETLAKSTLLTREEAARMLRCSTTKLDYLAAAGKLTVTVFDRRPRFQLSELQRFINAHTGKQTKSRGGNKSRARRGNRSSV